ncbi:hypothetical protein D3C78_1138000 [compost metagenome]
MAGGEELLLLQLDALPRRITQHYIETSLLAFEHLRKGQPPVEEALAAGDPLRQFGHFWAELALMGGNKFLVGWDQPRMLGILGHEEGGGVEVFQLPRLPGFVALLRSLPGGLLGRDLFHGVFRERFPAAGQAAAHAQADGQLLGCLLVALLRFAGNCLAVAGQRLVGVVGNARLQHRRIEYADQRIAALDMCVEKAQRLARLQRFQP